MASRCPDGPELIKGDVIQVINDGPQKPSSIHTHVGQRPILAAGNTDGDLAMLQWTAASSHRTLQRTRRYPTWAPRPAQYGARSWRLSTLPEPVRGSSAAKSTERGTL
jgi:hypothetical protein